MSRDNGANTGSGCTSQTCQPQSCSSYSRLGFSSGRPGEWLNAFGCKLSVNSATRNTVAMTTVTCGGSISEGRMNCEGEREESGVNGSGTTQSVLRWWWLALACFAATALVISRRPDAILHAQFFAEDGHVWFADAYNLGWFTSLFRTQDGYFQTLPRLAAASSLLVPLSWAPLVTNLIGLIIQILPVPLLLSTRLSRLGSLQLRSALAFIYIALPNCREMNVTITEAQWHLALVACLLVVSSPPVSRTSKICDVLVFVLCGTTGPFAIPLALIAGIWLIFRRARWGYWPLAIFASAAAIQTYALLAIDSAARNHWPLGANVEWLIRIMAGQVYVGTILGSNDLAVRAGMTFLVCVAIVGSILMAYCFYKACLEWRLLLLFSLLLFAASLRSPMTVQPEHTVWQLIAQVPGIRYWFFPTLAFAWTLVWFVFSTPPQQLRQVIGGTLLLVQLTGFIRDWRYPEYKNLNFVYSANEFTKSAPGTPVTFPENPNGWSFRLLKH